MSGQLPPSQSVQGEGAREGAGEWEEKAGEEVGQTQAEKGLKGEQENSKLPF